MSNSDNLLDNLLDNLWLKMLFVGTSLGVSTLSWVLYKYPDIRSKAIKTVLKTAFSSSDYIYDKYNKLRYDDKIRKNELRTYDISKHFSAEQINECVNYYYLSHVFYRNNDYYILRSRNSLDDDKQFEIGDIIVLPWLAVSLNIETIYQQNYEINITDNLKQFWIKHNELPFNLEYYDFWIKELIPNKLLSSLKFKKEEIKHLELSIINENGDFISYSNVLIKPQSTSEKIDLIYLKANEEIE